VWIRNQSCLPVEIIPHGIDLLGLRHIASARCVGDANMRWGRRFQRDLWRLVDGRMGKSSAASSVTVASELELADAR
jgi:hypothetical protein